MAYATQRRGGLPRRTAFRGSEPRSDHARSSNRVGFVKEEPLISRKRSWSKQQRNERRKRTRKLKRQEKQAAIRAKYGPSMRVAPVTVKRMDGTVIGVAPATAFRSKRVAPLLENLALEAGFPSYEAYLQSPHWKSLRRRVLQRDQWRCRLCGRKKDLQVHHDRYTDLLSEDIRYLKTMCRKCHERIHS